MNGLQLIDLMEKEENPEIIDNGDQITENNGLSIDKIKQIRLLDV